MSSRRHFNDWIRTLTTILTELEVTKANHRAFALNSAFSSLISLTKSAKKNKRTIFLIGNGASASIASHISADLCKNGGLSTEVFTDLSLVTAVANDCGAEFLYSVPLQRRGKAGDILVAISSSGNSPNILKAVAMARTLKMSVITFSAMSPTNSLRSTGDLNFYVPAPTYGYAESAHSALLHFWVDQVADT